MFIVKLKNYQIVKEEDKVIRYLSGWRWDDKSCWYDYKRMSNNKINEILDYESNWLCKSEQ